MTVATERKSAYEKALLIASGPAMLERMVRPLKEAGLAVNACESFQDAEKLFDGQALVVLPIKEDEQDEAKAFIEQLRNKTVSPYILGVGRCDEARRQSLVAKMGLNDLITYPFVEEEVQQRLASFRSWCQMPAPNALSAPEETSIEVPRAQDEVLTEMLQTTRVSLFAGVPEGEDEEAPESIYCREAPVGIAMFDRKLGYLLANPRWIQQFRLKDKQVLGRSQFEVFPKLHPNWKKIYQRCLNGETRRGRETVNSVDGPVEMRWEVRPWHYRSGQIGGVTIAFEEAWKASGQPAPAEPAAKVDQPAEAGGLPEQLESPALILDLQGEVLECNEAAKRLGLSKPEDTFLEELRQDPNKLSLTTLAELPGSSDRVAWSATVLRDSKGEPERILRVGVLLEEAMLPKVEKVVVESAAVEVVSVEDAKAPSIPSFDNESLDELSALLWKANLRGEITYFNRAWLEFRDRPLARELNGGWLDGLHASDARVTKDIVAEAIRNQKSLSHTFRLKSGKGDFASYDMWVSPYHSSDGELLGFYGHCEEHSEADKPAESLGFARTLLGKVAKRSQGESEALLKEVRQDANEALSKLADAEREIVSLKESLQAKPEALTEQRAEVLPEGPFMMLQTDAGGSLSAVNAAWNKAFNQAADAAPVSDWLEVIPDAKERQTTRELLVSAASQGVATTCRFTWKQADQVEAHMELQAVPLLDNAGVSVGLSGLVRDVTDEHGALQTLQSIVSPEEPLSPSATVSKLFTELSNKLPQWQRDRSSGDEELSAFREIFDHVAVGVVLLGADGKAIFANRRHRDLLGFEIEAGEGVEGWLRRGGGDADHVSAVLKIWQEDIWQRQLTKVLALKASNGTLREIRFVPQLFIDDNRLLLTLHDVTESKRGEDAMRDSEIRFRALFRESLMGIALLDGEEKIYDVNPGMEEILKVARRQILCRPFDESLHPEDIPRKRQVLAQLLDSPKRNAEMELRLARRREEGGVSEDVWIRLHIALVRDADQRVLFTAYFVQDITEQKRLQAALHISKEQNRALLEVIPDLILLVGRRGEVVDLMPGDHMPDDFVDAEAMGKRVDAILPSFGAQSEALIQRAYVADDVVLHPFTTPSGQTFTARIVACKPDNAVITVQEDRKEVPPVPVAPAEPEIPQEIERMALTFHSAPGAVVIMNYSGSILHWNPAAGAMFGYSESEAQGQPLPALFGLDSIESLTRHLKQDSSNRLVGELPFQRKDRTEGLAELVFAPLKEASGSLKGQVAFLRDLPKPEAPAPEAPAPVASPEVSQVAREALAKEIREESLSTLVPQMHQRLRNNLQIIGTLLNLQYKSQADPNTRSALRTSRNRAHALLLLHELIQQKEDEERVNFHQFATSLCDHLLESYQAKERVHIVFEVDGLLDLQAASPLSLILNELVTNAIDHGFPDDEQGTITISMKLAQSTGELSVRDDGFGLGSGNQGAGMGLQIVKTLANQVGGTLEKLDNTETEFRVCFMTSQGK